jgi:hypothetical protein
MAVALAGWLLAKEAIVNKRSKLFYLVAIGWVVFMMLMAALVLRNTDPPARKAPAQTTHATPTDFKGPDYSEGLITEYHEEHIDSLPVGAFTVVVDGVEYRAQEAYGSLPTPIKPGHYQVVNRSIGVGIITVFIGWQSKPDVVSGFITSERLVTPSNQVGCR